MTSSSRLMPLARLVQHGKWRTEAMRSYDSDLLLWFTRGQGRITVGGITRGYGAHNAVFIPAHTMHSFEISKQVFGFALYFGAGATAGLPDKSLHLRIRESAAQTELTGLIDQFQRESITPLPGQDRAMAHYAGLISVWLERQARVNDDALAPTDASRRLANRYAELVEQNFRSPKSVSDYAAMLKVTPTHLTRACKETNGRTASQFLSGRKLAEARRLLADTKQPVKDIAADLGFASAAYFSRAFQQGTGQPPRNFRRSAR